MAATDRPGSQATDPRGSNRIVRLLDWLHARSGYRTGLRHVLDEPLPPGTSWWFTLGSALLFLIAVQLVTGAVLTMYYAPTPDHAWESVRFIMREARLGWLVRGLHFFGASAIVIAVALHILRVIFFGSYKAPRELTWLTGVALLLVLLAFALTGYLLPWDQRAYWATVVTINLVGLPPLIGPPLATLVRGGAEVGALTLTRWYAAHVILLPALLALLVGGHLYLMRRHGISGPVRARPGERRPFFPYQAARDVTVSLALAAGLVALASYGMPELEAPADPADATYTPRPEWYFLGLFQLLKYFPSRWEIVGALLIPGVAVAALALLPWLDRSPDRDPRRRRGILAAVSAAMLAIVALTTAGWRDTGPGASGPAHGVWTPRQIAGAVLAETAGCERCHGETAMADAVGSSPLSRPPRWVASHVVDPEMIAPGLRPPPRVNQRDVDAIVAYVSRLSRGDHMPAVREADRSAAVIFARHCVGCHRLDGDGGGQGDDDGPDLSRIGGKQNLLTLRRWIADPESVDPDATMPAFENKLTPAELETIAGYLASRR
jgi:ubiquinol-cytochrome c reductase cytochrome b subunit